MEPLVLNMRLSGQATQPTGDPPEADVQGAAESVTVEGGSGIEVVTYENHVIFTGETSFTESGRISVGDSGDALIFSTGFAPVLGLVEVVTKPSSSNSMRTPVTIRSISRSLRSGKSW
jgi:hypothetical protein